MSWTPKDFISMVKASPRLLGSTGQFALQKHHAAPKEMPYYKENVTQNNLHILGELWEDDT